MKNYQDTFAPTQPQEQLDPGEAMRPNSVPATPSGWGSYGDMWRSTRPNTGNWLDDYMASGALKDQPTGTPAGNPDDIYTSGAPNTVIQSWSAQRATPQGEPSSGFHTDKTPSGDFAGMEADANASYAAERQAKASAMTQQAKGPGSQPQTPQGPQGQKNKPEAKQHFKSVGSTVDPSQGAVPVSTPTVAVPEAVGASRLSQRDDGSVWFRGPDGSDYQMDPNHPAVQRTLAQQNPPQAPQGDLWEAAKRRA